MSIVSKKARTSSIKTIRLSRVFPYIEATAMTTRKIVKYMTNFNDTMLEVANMAARIPGVKKILKPLYYPIKNFFLNKKNASFKSNGVSVLDDFNKCLNKIGVPYCLAFGSMLGAVREKGFIKHDLDIDVFVWIEDHSQQLVDSLNKDGFKLIHVFLVEDGKLGREETYEKNGVCIDIFYVYPAITNYPYCCDFTAYGPNAPTHRASMKIYGRVLPRRFEIPLRKSFILVPFETLMLPIPKNADEFLAFRYGADYMIPNPKWSMATKNNYIHEWPEVVATYKDIRI